MVTAQVASDRADVHSSRSSLSLTTMRISFLRKCPMRKTCKRDTERREVCSFMVSPPSKQFRIRFPLRAVPLSGSDLLITSRHGNSSGSERPCRCALFTVFSQPHHHEDLFPAEMPHAQNLQKRYREKGGLLIHGVSSFQAVPHTLPLEGSTTVRFRLADNESAW